MVQGRLELFQLNEQNEEIVAVCGPGTFTGELIEIEREALRTLVQTESQLSDVFLRAFILRRLD